MCTAFCKLNHINYAKMDPMEVERRMQYGRKHMEFVVDLYNIQWKVGRYFLHEHPAGASSWGERCISNLLKRNGVVRVVGDQCRYGLTSTENGRVGPAKESTRFMTNSPCGIAQLTKRCQNTKQHQVHRHVALINGRPRVAQVYPLALCRAICRGIRKQIKADSKGQFLVAQIEIDKLEDSQGLMKVANELHSKCRTVEEDDHDLPEEACDDVSGAQPNPAEVKKARREEVEYIKTMDLYTKVPITE